MQMTSKN